MLLFIRICRIPSILAPTLLLVMAQKPIQLVASLFHQVVAAEAASLVEVVEVEAVLFKKCLYSLT